MQPNAYNYFMGKIFKGKYLDRSRAFYDAVRRRALVTSEYVPGVRSSISSSGATATAADDHLLDDSDSLMLMDEDTLVAKIFPSYSSKADPPSRPSTIAPGGLMPAKTVNGLHLEMAAQANESFSYP